MLDCGRFERLSIAMQSTRIYPRSIADEPQLEQCANLYLINVTHVDI